MPRELHDFLSRDHARLDALQASCRDAGEAIPYDAYDTFRRGLLRTSASRNECCFRSCANITRQRRSSVKLLQWLTDFSIAEDRNLPFEQEDSPVGVRCGEFVYLGLECLLHGFLERFVWHDTADDEEPTIMHERRSVDVPFQLERQVWDGMSGSTVGQLVADLEVPVLDGRGDG